VGGPEADPRATGQESPTAAVAHESREEDAALSRDPRHAGTATWARDFVVRQEAIGVAVPLMVLLAVLWFTRPGFFSTFSVEATAAQAGIYVVVGLSQLSVLSIGQMNLALPAISVSSAMVLAYLSQSVKIPFVIAVLATLLVGAIMGALQGILVAYGGLNAFITTLGLANLYMGVMFLASGSAFYPGVSGELARLGTAEMLSIPLITWIAAIVAVAVFVTFQRTVSGRETLAVGASNRAALFSAIPVRRRMMLAHAFSGLLAAAAAVLAVANLAELDTSLGQQWLLPSFVAPVLGGSLLTGGRVTVVGTVLGGLLLAVLQSGLVVLGVNQYWYQMGLGLVLLFAIFIGQARVRYLMGRGG